MKALVKKVAALLPDLEARGQVYLFALGEREDISRWDVILSAAWSDTNYTAAIRFVADALVARLEPSELTELAGVTVIPSSEPNIQHMPRSLRNASPEEDEILNLTLMGVEVQRAFIFKAQQSPEAIPAKGSLVETAIQH